MYGGWDRDAMEGDVTGNGQNTGDRMIDWNGVYNLCSHCNSAYGGFNDVRAAQPGHAVLAAGPGVRSRRRTHEGRRPVRHRLRLQRARPGLQRGDVKDNSGPAYPTTPGHFEQFSCAP